MRKHTLELVCITALLIAGVLHVRLHASTLTVCAAGCTYTNAQLQTAINDAAPGDTILLQQGFSYVGEMKLRQKSCAANNATCYITMKTGVTSTGTTMSAGLFPVANMRITPSYESVLAKLVVQNNNESALRTVEPGETGAGTGCTVAPCVAKWWKIALLEFQQNVYAGNEMIRLGSNDSGTSCANSDCQDLRSEIPSHFILDQIDVHGRVVEGSKRGIAVYANDVTITNSYIYDIKNVSNDDQAIALGNSEGPYTITNNYLQSGTENFMSGGAVPQINQVVTITSPSTTGATFSAVTDLQVGQGLACTFGTIFQMSTVTNIAGNVVTWSPAMPNTPDTPGSCSWNVNPGNLTYTKNFNEKPLSWRNPITPTPTGVTATGSTTGGSLGAGTYFYRVVANITVALGNIARSTASTEVSATVASGTTGSVTISWTAVPNVTNYYVYGRSAGGENVRFTVTAPTVTFTDTGAAGTTSAVPTTAGTTWFVKNLFELKNMDTALIEGNVFSGSWRQGQDGYAVLFTTAATGDNAPSTVVRHITFRNNIVHSAVGMSQITAHDASSNIQTSQRTVDINMVNNLIYDIGTAYNGGVTTNVATILITSPGNSSTTPREGPKDVTIEHNTILALGTNDPFAIVLGANGVDYKAENLIIRNNIFRRLSQGLRYSKSPGGTQAEGLTSWNLGTMGTSIWTKNVMAGATCSIYPDPTNNFCPTEAELQAAFVSYATNDYNLAAASAWNNAGTDGKDIGVDMSTVTPFTNIALSGDNTGAPPPAPPNILTSTVPGGTVGSSFSPTTFAADTCSGTCSWSVISGSLPTGLSLSTGGLLSGTPTVAGSYSFTVQAHSSTTSLNGTRDFTSVILDAPVLPSRPTRIDYVENGIFVRDVEPTIIDDNIRVGDFWVDLTNGQVKWLSSTSPAPVWSSLGGGGGSTHYQINFPFQTVTSAYTSWALTTTLSETFTVTRNRIQLDLSDMTQCRIWSRIATAGTNGATIWAQYSINNGSSWNDLGTTAGTPTLDTTITSSISIGSWVNIDPAAKTDSTVRLVGQTTSSTSTPTFGNLGITCKSY